MLDTDRQEHFAITCGLSGDQNVTNQTVNTEGAIIRQFLGSAIAIKKWRSYNTSNFKSSSNNWAIR